MSKPKRYRVVGACAVVTQDTVHGAYKTHVWHGAIVGAGAKPEEIEHHLSVGLIELIEDDEGAEYADPDNEPSPNDADTDDKASKAKTGKAKADEDEASKAKTAAVDKGKSKSKADDDAALADLREKAVKAGMDPAEVAKASADELTALLKK